MEWLQSHYAETLLILGIILLAIEVLVLGFGTFFLFFIGLALVVTSGLIALGVIPDEWLASLLSVGILTGVFAGLLWKKLKFLQSNVDKTQATNDLVGHRFICPADVEPLTPLAEKPTHDYSGVTWRLCSSEPISRGTPVVVSRTEVGKLHVKPDPNA